MRGRPPTTTEADDLRMRKLREAGATIENLMGMFDLSEASVLRRLARLRKKMGPETIPNRQRARWHLTARISHDVIESS